MNPQAHKMLINGICILHYNYKYNHNISTWVLFSFFHPKTPWLSTLLALTLLGPHVERQQQQTPDGNVTFRISTKPFVHELINQKQKAVQKSTKKLLVNIELKILKLKAPFCTWTLYSLLHCKSSMLLYRDMWTAL